MVDSSHAAAAMTPRPMVPRGARHGRTRSGSSLRSNHTATLGNAMPIRYVKFAAAIIQIGSPASRNTIATVAVNSDRDLRRVLAIATSEQAGQQAVIGQLRQRPGRAGQRLDSPVEHAEDHEPDRGALARSRRTRGRTPARGDGRGRRGRAPSGRRPRARRSAGTRRRRRPWRRSPALRGARPDRIAHLADVTGRGLEGGRGEADQIEPGHRARTRHRTHRGRGRGDASSWRDGRRRRRAAVAPGH